MYPTLFVGLGGTGALAVRSLKHKYYEDLRQEERTTASFLVIDLDLQAVTRVDDGLAKLDPSEYYYLNPEVIKEFLRSKDRLDDSERLVWRQILEWFPDQKVAPIPISDVEQAGAGQYRALGRLSLFLNRHDQAIESLLRRKLGALLPEVDSNSLTDQKRVVIVSSLAGGTGAGLLIDLAYLCKRQESRPRVDAYLLLPEAFIDVDQGGRVRQNAYAALRELAHLKDQQIGFSAKYYHIPPVDVASGGEQPFSRLYLFRSEPAAGDKQILACTATMADALLGQLQRNIQTLSLSISNNAPTSESPEVQRRLRKHCFSSVSSARLKAKAVRHTAVEYKDLILRGFRDPKFRQGIVDEGLQRGLDMLSISLAAPVGQVPLTAPLGKSANASARIEAITSQIVSTLRDRAVHNASTVLGRLKEKIKGLLDAGANLPSKARQELGLREQLDTILDIVSKPYTKENYLAFVDSLRKVEVFKEEDKEIKDMSRDLLQILDQIEGPDPGLAQKALLEELLTHEAKLFPRFPEASEQHESAKAIRIRQGRKGSDATSRWWKRIWRASPDFWDQYSLKADLQAASEIVNYDRFHESLASTFQARGALTLLDGIRTRIGKSRHLAELADRVPPSVGPATGQGDAEVVSAKAKAFLQEQLPSIIREFEATIDADESQDRRVEKLQKIVDAHVQSYPELLETEYVLEKDEGSDSLEQSISSKLVLARKQAFEDRSPNPIKQSITIVMIPRGLRSRLNGPDEIKEIVRHAADQILATRSQPVDYDGEHIWIYHESLFHPPDHIAGIDEDYRLYSTQGHPELFHIDRRLLEDPGFLQIWFPNRMEFASCGNSGCRGDIAGTPKGIKVCPHCSKMIRSRCGNINCSRTDIHTTPNRLDKTCPACRGYNHSAWWCCTKHGNVPVDIPIDKERCPECLLAHDEDPQAFPAGKISIRPDVRRRVKCPNCEGMESRDPSHKPFWIPSDLLPYFENGVNGHNLEVFREVANRNGLPELFRCPKCRAHLIPVDEASLGHSCERTVAP